MAKEQTTFDVFISHSFQDATIAADVARALRSYGVTPFILGEVAIGENIEDALWEAMAESQAFIAIIPESEPAASIAFELGAARAWNKPIYAIASNSTSTRVPVGLPGMTIYPTSRIEEIALDIKAMSMSISDAEQAVLVAEYRQLGIPVDQLLLQPNELSKLTSQFRTRAKRNVSSEELMRVLLRLRKQGKLPIATAGRSRKTT